FACGFLSVLISGVIVGLSLIFTEENFLKVSGIIIAAHIPVMLIEGIITAACVAFLRKVRPEMLPGYHG
ncbi:MAG: energy-coupling factor ABC transporter permease, partial [Desulfobacterales bacterium]